jgi:hypothetical protein
MICGPQTAAFVLKVRVYYFRRKEKTNKNIILIPRCLYSHHDDRLRSFMAMGEQMPAFWNSSVVCNVHVLDSNNNTILHRGKGTPRSCCYHSHPPRDLHTEHQSYSSFFLRVKHTALSDNQLQFTNLDPSEAYSFIWQSTLISQIQVASFETNQQKLKGKFLSTYRPN